MHILTFMISVYRCILKLTMGLFYTRTLDKATHEGRKERKGYQFEENDSMKIYMGIVLT